MKLSHFFLAIFVMAIWGVNFSVIKIGLSSVDPFVLAGLRFALCALPAVFFIKRPSVPLKYMALYGLIFGVGLWGVVNVGIQVGISAGIASLILQFSAFFTMLLGAWVFKERLSPYQIYGMGIALLGLALIIAVTDGSVTYAGVVLVVLGAASWSVANVLVKKIAVRQIFEFLVWSSLFSPIPLFLISYFEHGWVGYVRLFNHFDGKALFSILFQVYPTTLFGYWVWNSLLKKYPVSTVAPLSLMVPIFGMLGSIAIFGETVGAVKLAAMVFILLGLIVGLYGHRVRTYFDFKTQSR
ncbi:EamA family transporter [Chromobacterium vaccinii]|uniref:EamA family transporter n=1 Tax=Chromobacterium vaccinii TaxID=1108595 RepID=UPI00061801BB|nr:EamA family transporter [Chromobacterium vaccinii]